jgi:hypothetical protein
VRTMSGLLLKPPDASMTAGAMNSERVPSAYSTTTPPHATARLDQVHYAGTEHPADRQRPRVALDGAHHPGAAAFRRVPAPHAVALLPVHACPLDPQVGEPVEQVRGAAAQVQVGPIRVGVGSAEGQPVFEGQFWGVVEAKAGQQRRASYADPAARSCGRTTKVGERFEDEDVSSGRGGVDGRGCPGCTRPHDEDVGGWARGMLRRRVPRSLRLLFLAVSHAPGVR